MVEAKSQTKIEFSHFTLADKALYERYLAEEEGRGCEFSFGNLYLWGRQSFAHKNGHILLFSQFDRRSVYPFPLGKGDIRGAIDAVIEDAAARGIPRRITGMSEARKTELERLYPGRFRFHTDEGSYDYVYAIEDLAELKGKKYHGKRNHLNRFLEAYPHYTVEELTEENRSEVEGFLHSWYSERLAENPDADYQMEAAALEKALRDYRGLELEGLLLYGEGVLLGFTMASRLSADTFDVHFEKARASVQGAYAAINQALARHIRQKYPEVLYLDREEDMGLEGLRRAKQSYYPHHMVKKYWACLLEEGYEY